MDVAQAKFCIIGGFEPGDIATHQAMPDAKPHCRSGLRSSSRPRTIPTNSLSCRRPQAMLGISDLVVVNLGQIVGRIQP